MSVLSVSFKDRLCFEAHSQYSPTTPLVPAPPPPPPSSSVQPLSETQKTASRVNLDFSLLRTRLSGRGRRGTTQSEGGSASRSWRWVDFSPRCHKKTPGSPKMVHNRRPSLLLSDPPVVVGERIGEDNTSPKCKKKSEATKKDTTGLTHTGEVDHDGHYSTAFNLAMKTKLGMDRERGRRRRHTLQHHPHLGRGLLPSGMMKDGFQTRLPRSRPGDDRVEKARERREYATYPYKNPKPFDHRGLSLSPVRDTHLCTTLTPRSLNSDLHTGTTKKTAGSLTRGVNFKFNTFKPREPRYDHTLILTKGPYPPAFTAYNAFLDRIHKNISS